MKRTFVVAAILVGLAGLLFFLQGTGLLPVGGMANHIEWAYIGGVMVVGAAALAVYALRPGAKQ